LRWQRIALLFFLGSVFYVLAKNKCAIVGWFLNYFIMQKREDKNKFFQFSTALLSGDSFFALLLTASITAVADLSATTFRLNN
jgi:hypothetical protein